MVNKGCLCRPVSVPSPVIRVVCVTALPGMGEEAPLQMKISFTKGKFMPCFQPYEMKVAPPVSAVSQLS